MTVDKKLLETLNEPNTIAVIFDGGVDSGIAQRWMAKYAPKVIEDARMYEQLELAQLQPAVTVCAVVRPLNTPAFNYHHGSQGQALSTLRPDSETFPEVIVTQPVKVADYWKRDNPRQPGKIDASGFLQALNESVAPFRFDYTDKGEMRPQILKLRTL